MSTDGCPTEQELLELLGGKLEESADASLHAHIDGCVACRSLLTEVGRATDVALEADVPIIDPDCYIVEARVSSGGLGDVLRARDRRLGRIVAIKQLRVTTPDALARFRLEALVTARLQHPAIIPIYEAGRWPSGELFYAMKLVTGRTLQDVIADAHTIEERLALLPKLTTVVDAIAYTHSQGVIHRDLKPANILIGPFGEAVVIDWGLARVMNASPAQGRAIDFPSSGGLTDTGTVLGTPAYMPPEQARGEDADERADVYALGAVLYHLLSGRAPFAGSSPAVVVGQVLRDLPPALGALVPGLPSELEAIVKKAMARDKTERHPTANELARELERFATARLVESRPKSSRSWLPWPGRRPPR